ncbi:lasso peptide isopeptide bond-forming cyclase [Salinibacter altiplanensis]|uniref:lasso peptide isopeptide bond-forming cyclase n=1 Tax=Salinibacter altiplanensis TaxID=1803181 RepID=UPI000C9FA785|nr:lasso peptide isopeptide bond-forming cyclase [Salinibacter altiplanensis]
MSGIAGLYYLDGRPVKDEVDRMVDVMEHRGPDGINTWRNEAVGLGHCMLETTPEDQHESLPLVDRGGALVVTADARIDNRDRIIKTLELQRPKGPPITDTELILAAYKQWGDDCPQHLLGAFVFAVWDGQKERLFFARDHFGVKQLYFYHKEKDNFSFASEIKSLLSLPDVPEEIDELTLGTHLANGHLDFEKTIFQNILRFPPGHVLTVTPSGVRRRRYWSLSATDVPSNLTDEEYAERFHSIFKEAVRCRLRSTRSIGSELSGGLDSSYVTCMAHRILRESAERNTLHTFSTVYDRFNECDERPYIQEVTKKEGVESHYTTVEEQGIIDLLDEIYEYLDDGRVSGNHHLNWLTSREASRSSVRVLLTGQDGDTTVYHGWQYFLELARSRQWEKFARLSNQTIRVLQRDKGVVERQETWKKPEDILGSYGSVYLLRWAREGDYGKLLSSLIEIGRHFSVSPWSIIRNMWRELILPASYWEGNRKSSSHLDIPETIDPQFVDAVGLGEHLRNQSSESDEEPRHITVRGAQTRMLKSAYLVSSFEKIAHYAAATGIEARHPFMDKRLIEFCLGLPPQQSLSNGWSRVIMRRAMKGVVPDSIRKRTEKANLAAPFRHLLIDLSGEEIEEMLSGSMGEAEKYVDQSHLSSLYRKAKREETSVSQGKLQAFANAISLAHWFRRR